MLNPCWSPKASRNRIYKAFLILKAAADINVAVRQIYSNGNCSNNNGIKGSKLIEYTIR